MAGNLKTLCARRSKLPLEDLVQPCIAGLTKGTAAAGLRHHFYDAALICCGQDTIGGKVQIQACFLESILEQTNDLQASTLLQQASVHIASTGKHPHCMNRQASICSSAL